MLSALLRGSLIQGWRSWKSARAVAVLAVTALAVGIGSAEIDERKHQLRYVNAGHNPPYLLRYVAIEELPAGGTVIGLFPQSSYEEAIVDLHPGDVLMAFTDGVPEALDPAEEEFGEERLKLLLRDLAHLSVEEISVRIAGALKAWVADAPQYDDLTFILLKVRPAAE